MTTPKERADMLKALDRWALAEDGSRAERAAMVVAQDLGSDLPRATFDYLADLACQRANFIRTGR